MDILVENLEKRIEKLQATLHSAVRQNASERDVLAAAAEIRNLLSKAVADDKTHLNLVFGGECERIGRIRYALDAVKFSHINRNDCRWRNLNEASTVIEHVLKSLGVYKPWKPPQSANEFSRKPSKSLTVDQPDTMSFETQDECKVDAVTIDQLDVMRFETADKGSVLDAVTESVCGRPAVQRMELLFPAGPIHATEKLPEKLPDKLAVDAAVKPIQRTSTKGDSASKRMDRSMEAECNNAGIIGSSLALPASNGSDRAIVHTPEKLPAKTWSGVNSHSGREAGIVSVDPAKVHWVDGGLGLDPEKGLWMQVDWLPAHLFA